MKQLMIILLLFTGINLEPDPTIEVVRNKYDKVPFEKEACTELIALLKPYGIQDQPLYVGYRACATMIMAKHVFSPFKKISYFKEGKEMLNDAIHADLHNVELRFLRFGAQTESPSFLNYDDHIKEDKIFLIKSLTDIHDLDLEERIRTFLLESDFLSPGEKELVKI